MIKLFKLEFTSPLHISTVRADLAKSSTQIHSDTLYAAIIQTWVMLGETDLVEKINIVEENKLNNKEFDFKVSSLFPVTKAKNGKDIFFLPRILKPFHKDCLKNEFNGNAKTLKKIEWLDLDYFEEHSKKKEGCFPIQKDVVGKYLSKNALRLGNSNKDFIQKQVNPRVTIPRTGGNARPYYIERLLFQEGSGLYFIFQGTEEIFSKIALALVVLSENGLGTNRNLGNGRFKLELLDCPQSLKALLEGKGDYYTNLSLFNPNSEEQLKEMLLEDGGTLDKNVGYDWIKRGGWITNEPYLTLRKKGVYMFKEGSIFKTPKDGILDGYNLNVRPDKITKNKYPIWRTGKSLFVPITF